ncbi:phosphogluconate dehydratase [Bermanella marisrubri]|uniref:Phosphogluconate dehydratase n=1 Tax=Bermanella marisrubri TaxID=207949 RepID=Q1N5N8_9GAMM|nr:phosphogluconate dehydratase [Bermanella marisrubri]EAT13904.1 6-phosphogluconate dehydratase [Oceanobacter sp. RED65] [Bermanella marisrubri]QIZ84659.1 phosphogluconate dehydratase [Bermanella marisrubri]
MNKTLQAVTQRIVERSQSSRAAYLNAMQQQATDGPARQVMSCGNLAHGFAACKPQDKESIKLMNAANIGIVTAFNDMLSAHQPYEPYPNIIKQAAQKMGSTAQVAGGVPAMCDGVTQGQPGMDLSLFSRDVIAMSTAVSLSHNMFDGGLCLGICDKIVPGMLMGALSFGHLPFVFVPAGPMASGISNQEKAKVRQLYAEGKASREELLETESKSYHSHGTCTFYGTANSNQLLLEVMGLHIPGSSFIHPDSPMRQAMTEMAVEQVIHMTNMNQRPTALYEIVSEKTIVNALVALLATGGSTNHTMHWVAIARCAGIQITWDDYAELSEVVPLLTKIYPNGQADINHFTAAGGVGYLIKQLLKKGLLHEDVQTVLGKGLSQYCVEPHFINGQILFRPCIETSQDKDVLANIEAPFSDHGGLQLMRGNLGRGVIKTSAVKSEHQSVCAPAVVVNDQNEVKTLFESGELNKDVILVVRFQGPQAIGMPELHKLTPYLGSLQDKGYKVGLVTDGRMSGASGKVPAAIHVYPEAKQGGALAKVQNGDVIELNGATGQLNIVFDSKAEEQQFWQRPDASMTTDHSQGLGRELFSNFRKLVTTPEKGAMSIDVPYDQMNE